MNGSLTVSLPGLLGLWLVSELAFGQLERIRQAEAGPVNEHRQTMQRTKKTFDYVKPAHSALMGNQSSVGGELAREPH